MAPTSVSVVVATRGRPEAVERCLGAVAEGSLRPAEVVLVEQGAAAPVERLRERLAAAGIDLVHVPVPPTSASRSRNSGIEAARSGLLAFTDDDCVPDREWLAGLVGGLADGVGAVSGRVLPLPSGEPGLVPVSSRPSKERRTFHRETALSWEAGTGGNLLVPRATLARVGGFDPRLGPGTRHPGAEDVELLDRILAAGYTVVYEPEALVRHEMKTRRARVRTRFRYAAGMGAFLARRAAAPGRPSLVRAYLRAQAGSLAGGLARGRFWQALEAGLSLAGFAAGFASARLRPDRDPAGPP